MRIQKSAFLKKVQPYCFIGPALVLLFVLMLAPIITVIVKSFMSNYIISPDSSFVGFEHYKDILLGDPVFLRSLINTIVFTIFSVALHLIIGLAFAMLLNYPLPGRWQSFFRVILIFPWAFTVAIVAIDWKLILDPMGIVNYWLMKLGLIDTYVAWFAEPKLAMIALVFVNTWRGYPFIMVSLLAGLQGIPKILYEAGKIDGAGKIQCFTRITLPQLRPVLLSIGLLDSIWTFRLFPMIWLTTGGGPGHCTETLSTYTYRMAFNRFEFSKASALAVIILLFTSALAVYYVKQQRSSN